MSEKGKPTSVRMSPEEVWEFVTHANRAIFVTLRRDGVPIALPMGFAVVDGKIYMYSRGKKNLRIQNDARSAFLVEVGDHWSELKAVHFTGRSDIVEAASGLKERIDAELHRKHGESHTPLRKMPDATRAHYQNAGRVIVRFTPDDRVLSWDNTKLPIAR